MRVNIYEEELTTTIEVVSTSPAPDRTYYGVRIYLKSHPHLHHNALDDDRSAITIWVGGLQIAEDLCDTLAIALVQVPEPDETT